MAYIAPNSTILICHGVPLSSDYIHTVDFENSTLQSAYFLTKAKFKLEKYSYQRKNGVLTVALTTEQLYDCNYIAYKNTSFENKWFYGFITNIEYVSNEVTNIYFSEDVLQTWMFDYTLNPCFVAREHTLDDTIGSNIQPESLELGPYIYEKSSYFNCADRYNLAFIIAAGAKVDDQGLGKISAAAYEGSNEFNKQQTVYEGLCLNIAHEKTYDGVKYTASQVADAYIEAINSAGLSDSIVAVVCVPYNFIQLALATQGHLGDYPFSDNKPYTTIAGYKPKNNKLFTSPYKYLEVNNHEGQSANYEYELFGDDKIYAFAVNFALQVNFAVILRARNYKNKTLSDESITVCNFPQCSYISDTYKTWYAQNQVRYKTAITKSALNAALSIATTGKNAQNAIDAASYAISQSKRRSERREAQADLDRAETGFLGGTAGHVIDLAATVADYMVEKQAHQVNNISAIYSGDDTTSVCFDKKGFVANQISITPRYAQIIDGYFSQFGYATNLVKRPNTTGRASWNYVKTVGCDAQGSIPQYAIEAINAIFNTGITIWHNPAWVGDYTRDNSITGNG